MDLKDQFMSVISAMEIPSRRNDSWFKSTFNIDQYREYVSVHNTESVDFYEIFGDAADYSKDDFKQLLENFLEKHVQESRFTYEHGSFSNFDSISIQKPAGKRPEDDNEVVNKMRKWLTEYIKQEKEYKKYLELKAKFEGEQNGNS